MRDTLSLNNAREPPRSPPFLPKRVDVPPSLQAWDNESFEESGGAKPLRFDRGDWNEAADDPTPSLSRSEGTS